MKKSFKSLYAGMLVAISSNALAHPGHDHAHWLSEPIHVLSALAIGAIVMTVVMIRMKKESSDKN